MSKRKAIDFDALQGAAGQTVPPIKKLEAKAAGTAPSRTGKVQIGAHVSPETRTALKVLSVELGRSVNDLMEEGIGLVLAKYKSR